MYVVTIQQEWSAFDFDVPSHPLTTASECHHHSSLIICRTPQFMDRTQINTIHTTTSKCQHMQNINAHNINTIFFHFTLFLS
jgi:hypothetical protein